MLTFQEKDMQKLKDFILNKKPHVIAVTAETRDAMMIVEDVKMILSELEQEEQIPPINVELVDNEVAMIFENSNKSQVGTAPAVAGHRRNSNDDGNVCKAPTSNVKIELGSLSTNLIQTPTLKTPQAENDSNSDYKQFNYKKPNSKAYISLARAHTHMNSHTHTHGHTHTHIWTRAHTPTHTHMDLSLIHI